MACTIIEVLKSRRNNDNTASIIIANLLCDTISDLPTQTGLTGFELAQGCKAHVIEDNQDYMMQSDGTWKPYGGEMWQNVYTKSEMDSLLDDKQDELDAAQLEAVNSGITAEKLATDESAISELVDDGAKNEIKFDGVGTGTSNVGTSYTSNGITFEVQSDGTIRATGTISSGNSYCYLYLGTSRINIIGTFDDNHVLSGNPHGAGIGTYRLLYKVGSQTAVSVVDPSVILPEITGETSAVLGLQVDAPQTNLDITFKPMICTKAEFNASQEYQPYAPSNSELYNMILSLQNGGITNLIYGMGVEIPNNSDLDDYKTPGTYYVLNNSNASTIANKPIGGSGFRLIVSYISASNRQRQEFYKPNTPDVIYIRNIGTDGNWSSWYQFTGTAVV